MALTKTILKVLGLASAAAPAGYAEVKEARASILVGGELAQMPLVHLVTDAGESLTPLTDEQLRATPLPVQLDSGTPGTGITAPAGGTGLAGWLSGIYKRLGDALNIRALSGATDSISISNWPSTQSLATGAATEAKQDTANTELTAIKTKLSDTLAVNPVTKEDATYLTGIAVVPTTVTTGLNYFWIRNPDSTKKIKIHKVEIILLFAGTAAASRSVYAMKKFTGATATTGTNTLAATAAKTGNPASIADIKWTPTGGTLTGASVDASRMIQIAHANQLTANVVYDRNLTDAPIVLGQNEGLVLQSDGAVVAGSTVVISLRWSEE